jgi:hypothetical protein
MITLRARFTLVLAALAALASVIGASPASAAAFPNYAHCSTVVPITSSSYDAGGYVDYPAGQPARLRTSASLSRTARHARQSATAVVITTTLQVSR